MREGWKYKKLGEVCNVLNGYAFKSKHYGNKGVRIIRITNVQKGYVVDENPKYYSVEDFVGLNQYVLNEGDLVMSLTGNVGRVGILSKKMIPAALNQRVACIRLKGDEIDKRYLFHYLNSDIFEQNAIMSARGIAQKNMSTEWLKCYEIKIPPKATQLDIVAELDQINDLIRLKKEQLKEYDNLAQSIFYDMFGDPVENEKGWEVKKFEELVELKNGLNFTPAEDGNKIRVIGVADFKDNSAITGIDAIGLKTIKEEISQDYYLKDGDILIVRSNGSKELVGRNLVVYTNGEMITFSGFCIRCRIKDLSVVSSVYLNAFLSKREIRMLLRQEGRGANISNINQKILNAQRVPLPPLPLQQEFSSRIEQIEKLKAEVQKTITDLETLLASRMQYWFE